MNYFEKWLNIRPSATKTFIDYIESNLSTIEKESHNKGPLDYEITLWELKSTLKAVKNGKSTGHNKISNEMIKNGGKALLGVIVHMYNIIIKQGQ